MEPGQSIGAPMDLSFTRHPKSVGESYGEHMGVAWSFGFTLLGAGLATPSWSLLLSCLAIIGGAALAARAG